MMNPRGRRRPRRSSGTERIFDDEMGRLWSASRTVTPEGNDAMVFTCLSDAREPPRALASPPDLRFTDVAAEELRELLTRAPKVARV
jgi:hypothetical protein